jgi:hypothetical protein
MEWIVCTLMEIFAIQFLKCPYKISKSHGLGVGFAKCYIDDIIVFHLTPRNHMHCLTKGVWKT